MTINRVDLTKNDRKYHIIQFGMTLYIVDFMGRHTGEERYLVNGWTNIEDIRPWFEDLGFSELTPSL
jgi:hypothetical protein